MKVLVKNASSETVIKNSRFISEAFVVTSQAMAREMWMRLKCSRPVYYTAMAN